MPEEILETRGERIGELILPPQDKDIFEIQLEKLANSKYVKPVLDFLRKTRDLFFKLLKKLLRIKPEEDDY